MSATFVIPGSVGGPTISDSNPIPVSGSLSGSGSFTVAQSTASNLKSQVTGAGTAGSADTGVQTVQGIAGMTPLTVTPGATEVHLGEVGGRIATPSANFTRPNDTTAYASGDLVGNSTTAASVVPLSWAVTRVAAGNCWVRRCRLKTSSTSVTNSLFRLHLYGSDPSASTGITNGDNGAWLTKQASYLGSFDINVDKAFSDAAEGVGAPIIGSEINIALGSGSTVYGLLEARAAYTPTANEVFTIELEVVQN